MKIIALEEHFLTEALTAAWARLPATEQDGSQALNSPDIARRILEIGEERLRLMDETGIDVQVLSPTAPGVQNLEAGLAVTMARELNDLTAEAVRGRPDRFQGFACLPTPAPAEAARELGRAVETLGLKGAFLFGRTRERNADRPEFLPIFEAAAALKVPIYIHPQPPTHTVRQAYYSGAEDELDSMFASFGLGWHYETGVQLVRLMLAGVFDRFPDLQVIVGHWGEMVLFYAERIAAMSQPAKLKRGIPEIFRSNVHVTPSGMFSQRYLRWTVEALGVERILFSADYPYMFAPDGGSRAFLEQADLSEADKARIAHGNWEALTRR